MTTKEQLNQTIYTIIGAAMEVHHELGYGLLEAVYSEALCLELDRKMVCFEVEKELPIFYKGEELTKKYRMDIVCEEDIVLELKAVSELTSEHRAQLFNYLRLAHKPLGLLINFGQRSLHVEKYFYDEQTNEVTFFKELQ